MTQERILVVDDEKGFREFMVSHLRKRDYEAESAVDGAEALEKLKGGGPFAVLVTDLAMPKVDGLELMHEVRPLFPQMEVIVITANDTIETAIAAMREYGAFNYLLKPLANNNELSFAVARALEYRRLRLERESLQAKMLADAERLQALIAGTGDAFISADASGVITVANPAAVRLLGHNHLVGANALDVLPRSVANVVANWQAVGGQSAVVEVPWGASAVQMVSLTPLRGSGEQSGGWVMILRDVTHLKRLDQIKTRLLADAANKIQMPLFQALNAVFELNQMTAEVKSDRFTKIVYGLAKPLDQIRKWVEDVLVMARIEAGIGIQPIRIDVKEVVEGWSQTAIKKLQQDKALRLKVDIEDDLPPVYADRDLMLRLLQQLIDQTAGREKTGSGRELHISVRHDQGQVWIDVTFEDFPISRTQQLRRITGGYAGTEPALPDLALVMAIANGMGGQVWIRDQETAGNAIAICLPAMTAGSAGGAG